MPHGCWTFKLFRRVHFYIYAWSLTHSITDWLTYCVPSTEMDFSHLWLILSRLHSINVYFWSLFPVSWNVPLIKKICLESSWQRVQETSHGWFCSNSIQLTFAFNSVLKKIEKIAFCFDSSRLTEAWQQFPKGKLIYMSILFSFDIMG